MEDTYAQKVWTKIVLGIGRLTFMHYYLDVARSYVSDSVVNLQPDSEKANLVSSELPNGLHAPVIDLDFPCYLLESSTPGKNHLYIDKEITWPEYEAVLTALLNANLIQKGWYDNCLKDKRTYVRLPHVRKKQRV